jgi:predicted ATPase
LKASRYSTTTLKNNLKGLRADSKYFQELRDVIIIWQAFVLLRYLDQHFYYMSRNINYIAPVRASAERFYRMQDLSVDNIDFKGRNLPMFIRDLSRADTENMNEWLRENFGFTLAASMDGGHLALKLKDVGSKQAFNVADMGFGFSQVLPLIVQIWAISSGRKCRGVPRVSNIPNIIAIEQPELHLHPGLQAMVADLFVKSVVLAKKTGIDLRIVAETHSETIINRIGHHIFKNNIDKESVSCVLFNKEPGAHSTEVKVSEFDNDGMLVDWPIGFFEPGVL